MELVPSYTVKRTFSHFLRSQPTPPQPRLRNRGHSPTTTLPVELVQRVFRTYLGVLNKTSTIQQGIQYSHDRLHAQFLLSSVCRNWRTCALDHSLLWTYIVVLLFPQKFPNSTRDLQGYLVQFYKHLTDLIQLLLARSGQAGLQILIPNVQTSFLRQNAIQEIQPARMAFLALASHHSRVRSLCMAPKGLASSVVWDIIGTRHVSANGTLCLHAPNLEQLGIKTNDTGSKEHDPPVVYLDAPQLRVCVIQGPTCLRPQHAPLVQLEVSIEANTLATWFRFLYTSAATIEDLYLWMLHPSEGSEHLFLMFGQPLHRTGFPRLSHFSINTAAYEPNALLAEIFSALSAPALHSAYLATTRADRSSSLAFAQFVQFLDKTTNGMVERLAISCATDKGMLNIDDSRTIIRHLPSIKVLTLRYGSKVTAGFIGTMCHLLPHIKIHIESAHVLLPADSPQPRLAAAVEAQEPEGVKKWFVFFDLALVNRDYDTVTEDDGRSIDRPFVAHSVRDAVVVWKHGSVEVAP